MRLVLLSMILAVSASAHAARNNPCKADVEKFCATTEKGQWRRWECLETHVAELSEACKPRHEHARDAYNKCKPFTTGECEGAEDVPSCLTKRLEDLKAKGASDPKAAECAAVVEKRQGRRAKRKAAKASASTTTTTGTAQ